MPTTFRRRSRNDRAAHRREVRQLRFGAGRPMRKFESGHCWVELVHGRRWRIEWSAIEAATRFANVGPTDVWVVPMSHNRHAYILAHQVVGFYPDAREG